MAKRGRMEGLWRVVRFNWRTYMAASMVAFVIAASVIFLHMPDLAKVIAISLFGLLSWFVVGSLFAAWWTYDYSLLHELRWLTSSIRNPNRILLAHAGYNELEGMTDRVYSNAVIRYVDFFDAIKRREPSIEAAHNANPAEGEPISRSISNWPIENLDLVLFPFAAHELRDHADRVQVLTEAARVLSPAGRIVVAEHCRDLANFVAFGPGAFHFFPHAEWIKCFGEAGLKVEQEVHLSPFASVFFLCK